jgi:hypothetical protein
MSTRNCHFVVWVAVMSCLMLTLTVAQVSAGGPVCPPRGCPPPMCAPPMMCAPPVCPPPACAPPSCGPRPCPPPGCKENPLAAVVKGAVRLVAGAVALPFKMVDCLLEEMCAPRCCPPGPGPCRVASACPPPCPPPACGPSPCFPGPVPGMMPAPRGFRPGPARKFVPFAEKTSAKIRLMAGPPDGLFGNYW